MGKAGHIARILAPYGLTIKSLICIIMVGLSCTTASSNLLYYLYVMRIRNIFGGNGISDTTANDVEAVISIHQDNSDIADYNNIGLLGYCEGEITNNKDNTTSCSKPEADFYFDPLGRPENR
ncbi:uncharacterized protein N7529_009103 [Penicillium soppii]|uniref:uncharacterized protein n=1 Tax=Penicillium soppii TaxID=69789 RepID=UPI002546BFC8|nr:uncharacterized protein N7529_009103 [Penicillium soppii]KAJ5861793.1 hypothetical protein N7529_009103 [Penicillium soppii]